MGLSHVQFHRSSEKVLHHVPVFPGAAAGRGHRETDLHRLRRSAGELRGVRERPQARQQSRRRGQLLPV